MMVNETAARNITSDQLWQRTVPTQMPWMTDYTSNSPSSVIHFGQSPEGSPPQSGYFTTVTTQTSPITTNSTNFTSDNNTISSISSNNNKNDKTTTITIHDLTPIVSTGVQPHVPTTLTLMPTKRSSIEVDADGLTSSQPPPSKQWLSESMMLRQFGSLNLNHQLHNINHDSPNYDADAEIDEEDEEDHSSLKKIQSQQSDSEELERYVYLLFKDKKHNDLRQFSQGPNQSTLNRLARDEMDKINKAVVLWNPCIHARPCNTTPEIEELVDQDSNDSCGPVIGKNCKVAADETGLASIIITEVSDDDIMDNCLISQNDDDLMVD